MDTYRSWLIEEAIPAGGMGPGEIDRIDDRHIADAILFAFPLRTHPVSLIDVGTGVGLPGIPLAILFPQTPVLLVDRSGRRVDLARRAVRVLGLPNVEVRQGEIGKLDVTTPVVVGRAVSPVETLTTSVTRLLQDDGVAIMGGSWVDRPVVPDWETLEIPREVLDRGVWLLIMRRQ